MASDIEMTVDLAEFGRDMARLAAASRRTTQEVLEQQCRLIAVDLIKCTPPTGNRPLTESLGFQRRKGESKVEMDVNRLFQPLTSIRAVMYPEPRGQDPKPSRRDFLKHLANEGKWQELSEALHDMHITEGDRVEVRASLSVEEYRSTWKLQSLRGRNVNRKSKQRMLVWDSSALGLVKREIMGRVGFAKGGWMAAVTRLAVKRIPSWISRHNAPGQCVFEGKPGDEHYSITLVNDVRYIAYLNSGNRLLARVLRNRERSMAISLEHAIDHFVEQFNQAGA